MADCRDQMSARLRFEDGAACADAQCLDRIRLFHMTGENDRASLWAEPCRFAQYGHAVKALHIQIEHGDLREQFLDQANRLDSIGGFAQYLDLLLLQHQSQSLTDNEMIIRKNHTNRHSFLHWNGYHQFSPTAFAGVDLQVPADNAQALANADQAEPLFGVPHGYRRVVKSSAIVAYATTNRIGCSVKCDPHCSRLRVLDHVVQRFFGDVVQGRLHALWQSLLGHGVDVYLQLGTLRESLEQIPQGRNQPQIVQ